MCLLRQESQYVGDGPFLVGAFLNGQMESGFRPFDCHQLQTMLRVNVLDGTTLGKEKKCIVRFHNTRSAESDCGIQGVHCRF